jgi:hypothetical protein
MVFVDESGDHSLESINPEFPIFVLAFCIVSKEDYVSKAVPSLQRLKLEHFGHDQVILHEREIRKREGVFNRFMQSERRERFLSGLNTLMAEMPFTIQASVIRKEALRAQYKTPHHPYHLSMEFGLERIMRFLEGVGNDQAGRVTHVIVESRGKLEDADLELEFRRICNDSNYRQRRFPIEIIFASKHVNCSGLQLADLVARPIGRHVMDPTQPNRAWDLIEPKLFRSPQGNIEGWGLKCFP